MPYMLSIPPTQRSFTDGFSWGNCRAIRGLLIENRAPEIRQGTVLFTSGGKMEEVATSHIHPVPSATMLDPTWSPFHITEGPTSPMRSANGLKMMSSSQERPKLRFSEKQWLLCTSFTNYGTLVVPADVPGTQRAPSH